MPSARITSYNVCYTKLLRHLFLWLLAALLLGESVWAAPIRVTVLSERDDGAYGTALQTLTETLAVLGGADAPAVESVTVAESDPLPRDRITAAHTDLVVTVGSRMAERVMQLRPEVPVLCVLLPEARITSYNVCYTKLLRTSTSQSTSRL